MVVPDFALISEIMMVAEGFLEARLLARKFITLYTLCKELLSKQVRISTLSKYFETVKEFFY
jgi:dynein heavy chain